MRPYTSAPVHASIRQHLRPHGHKARPATAPRALLLPTLLLALQSYPILSTATILSAPNHRILGGARCSS